MNKLPVTSITSFMMRIGRRLAVVILVLASLTCASLGWAKYTAAQKKASDHCIQVYQDAILNCLQKNPYMTTADCTASERLIYQDCMQKAGLARGDLQPPKIDPSKLSTNGVKPIQGESGSTASQKAHRAMGTSLEPVTTANGQKTDTRRGISGAPLKTATPTPTPSPKPKPTATVSRKPSQ